MTVNYTTYTKGLFLDSLEQRFIPINEDSSKDNLNFSIDKTYNGEYKICSNFQGIQNIIPVLVQFLNTHKATVENVNDYEIICKNENYFIQLGIKNISTGIYYCISDNLLQAINSLKQEKTNV